MPEQDSEQEALAALLASDGWALFVQHVNSEWGAEAYARKIDQAIANGKTQRESVESDLCELGAAGRAVKLAARWPTERLTQLRTAKPSPARALFQRRSH